MFCGDCINGEFQLTPTGRIRKKSSGRCLLEAEMKTLAEQAAAPCIVVRAHRSGIWHDTPATNCPQWLSKQDLKDNA